MALPNTDTLDIPSRGLPAADISNLTTGPNADTDTLDYPSRGLPAEYIQNVSAFVATTQNNSIKANIQVVANQNNSIKANILTTYYTGHNYDWTPSTQTSANRGYQS